MSNPSKQKGTAFETAVVNYLNCNGVSAWRLPLSGNKDKGDIHCLTWNLECKNVRAMALGQWVAEADVESANAGKPVAVVVKRIGKTDPGEAYVVIPLRVFAQSVLSGQSAILSE